MDDGMRRELEDANTAMAGRALRVLAVAYKKMADDKADLVMGDVEQGLVHLGLVGMIDPPRPEAIEAVKRCRQSGIRVIMATGDSISTARAIASEFGLIQEDSLAVDDAGLAGMTDEELKEKLPRIAVFARVEPAQKLRLVKILQQMGEVVATIEEQRLIIRVFLRKLHFDPDTRTGTAEFWLIPGAGNEDPRRNSAGRGRRTDIGRQIDDKQADEQATMGVVEQRAISFGG